MQIIDLDAQEQAKLLSLEESHFLDFKALQVAPAKLTRSLSAFANADGGTLYVGIRQDQPNRLSHWEGFENTEAANGHVQAFEEFFPLGSHASCQFLRSAVDHSLVLQVDVAKTPDVRRASDGVAYLRRGAQNLPQKTHEQIRRLESSTRV